MKLTKQFLNNFEENPKTKRMIRVEILMNLKLMTFYVQMYYKQKYLNEQY